MPDADPIMAAPSDISWAWPWAHGCGLNTMSYRREKSNGFSGSRSSPRSAEARPAVPAALRIRGVSQVRLRPPAHRVDRRAIWLWTLQALAGAIITAGLGAGAAALISATRPGWVPDWVFDRIWLLPVLIGVLFVPEVLIAPVWRYRVHRWEVSAEVVYTRAGWFSRSWQLVPVARVQTVDRTQGLLERLFGLATLKVTTASHAGSSLIVGLPDLVATELSETLAVQAGQLRDDAT